MKAANFKNGWYGRSRSGSFLVAGPFLLTRCRCIECKAADKKGFTTFYLMKEVEGYNREFHLTNGIQGGTNGSAYSCD